MKKPMLFLILVSTLFISNIYAQNEKLSRYPKSFETELGLYQDLFYFGFGINYKIKNKLNFYPNIRIGDGTYNKTTELVSVLYGGNLRYYFFEKILKQPQILDHISIFLSSGISGNYLPKDENDKYQISSNGLEMEFSVGLEELFKNNLAITVEVGYASMPVLIDTKAAQRYSNSPPLMDNVRSNLGGIFLTTRIGWFSFDHHTHH